MGTLIGGSTRSDVMAAAAQAGLELFTTDSQVGLWAFAAGHQEVLPIGGLTADRKAELQAADGRGRPDRREPGAALPDPAGRLQGNARRVRARARPTSSWCSPTAATATPSALRREQFKQDIQRLADPTRPIRVVLIGIGASAADASALQEIAAVVGGGYFPLTAPDQIQAIFLKALLRIGT